LSWHFFSHLPAAILASFVKRLSRLSLSAPPAAIVMIIPFTYNILKRHPALMVMIHSTGEDDREFNGNATCLSHLSQIIV
jgi:U3 small nucleolar RNA-associated protein 19